MYSLQLYNLKNFTLIRWRTYVSTGVKVDKLFDFFHIEVQDSRAGKILVRARALTTKKTRQNVDVIYTKGNTLEKNRQNVDVK